MTLFDYPEQAFRRLYHGKKNFITPTVLRYGWLDKKLGFAYELSRGSGITPGTQVFGVTVIRAIPVVLGNVVPCYHLSRCFNSLADANDYIRGLRHDIRESYKEEVKT